MAKLAKFSPGKSSVYMYMCVILKSMNIRSGHPKQHVSVSEGCLLSGIPLYYICRGSWQTRLMTYCYTSAKLWKQMVST